MGQGSLNLKLNFVGSNEAQFETCTWQTYAGFVSQSMQLVQKYNVLILLSDSIEWINLNQLSGEMSNAITYHGLTHRQKQDMSLIIGMQVLSLAQELTENLTATCFSYAEAIRAADVRLFPLLLRDFGRLESKKFRKNYPTSVRVDLASAKALYDAALNDAAILTEYFATCNSDTGALRQKLEDIVAYRARLDGWYNKYKHTHSTIPIALEGQGWNWHLLHRVFDHLSLNSREVACQDRILLPVVHGTDVRLPVLTSQSFMAFHQEWPAARQVGKIVTEIWEELREDRHKKLLGTAVQHLPSSYPTDCTH